LTFEPSISFGYLGTKKAQLLEQRFKLNPIVSGYGTITAVGIGGGGSTSMVVGLGSAVGCIVLLYYLIWLVVFRYQEFSFNLRAMKRLYKVRGF